MLGAEDRVPRPLPAVLRFSTLQSWTTVLPMSPRVGLLERFGGGTDSNSLQPHALSWLLRATSFTSARLDIPSGLLRLLDSLP